MTAVSDVYMLVTVICIRRSQTPQSHNFFILTGAPWYASFFTIPDFFRPSSLSYSTIPDICHQKSRQSVSITRLLTMKTQTNSFLVFGLNKITWKLF